MDDNLFHKAKEYFNNRIFQRIDQKILTYMVFVGIATIFWFFNKLGNDFTTTIDYPVRYANMPKNKVLVNELPKNLHLNVNSFGYKLLIYKLSPAPYPVVINLEDYIKQINNPNIKQFQLNTRYAREEINKQMPNDIEVLDILPDTISFQFANILEKKVPVKANVSLDFDQQCMLDGLISFIPDSIIVKGPHTILDTLSGVFIKKQVFSSLNKPLQRNVLIKEIKQVKYDKKRVIMNLPVSKFTQATYNVSIIPTNVPDTLELKTFPRQIQVTGLVSLNDYDKINESDFRVEVDYFEIAKLLGQKLGVKLILFPSKVKSLDYYPQSVEFIIEKSTF
ncbi:MAG: hypothetical protein JEZ09_08920 [Salinivirgaceae bacterium]|nr:hypothetical protein [Salinivirgaceae bacterium]